MATRWTPDTCADPPCQVLVNDDWTGGQFETKCKRHAKLDDAAAWQKVRAENTDKNHAVNSAMEDYPPEIYQGAFIQDENGTILKIDLPPAEMTKLADKLDKKFGKGVVRIETTGVVVPFPKGE